MAKNIDKELESLKNLKPEERIARLNAIKKNLEIETKKQEENIESIKKRTQDEIISDEKKNITDLLKENRLEEEALESTVEKEKPIEEAKPAQYGDAAERMGETPILYGEASDYSPNISEDLPDQSTPEQKFDDKKEVNVSKKLLDDLGMYRGY